VPDAPDSRAVERIAGLLLGAERAVALTGLRLGATEAVESGAAGGDWARRGSLEALLTDPQGFWVFFLPLAREIAAREPGEGHRALARLEAAGVVWALITQAADRLHARSGSPDPVEVHGNVLIARCSRCDELYGLPEVERLHAGSPDGVPRCTRPECAYPLRPNGTLWGEPLPAEPVTRAWDLAARADLFLVVDSQLRTAPMSLLPSVPLTRGVPLVLVGAVPTQYDRYAEVLVRSPGPPVLGALADLVAPEVTP
jgi:NAD-dependent deacetylase